MIQKCLESMQDQVGGELEGTACFRRFQEATKIAAAVLQYCLRCLEEDDGQIENVCGMCMMTCHLKRFRRDQF